MRTIEQHAQALADGSFGRKDPRQAYYRDGRWHDVSLYGILESEWKAPERAT